MVTVADLFSGIGGFHLAALRATKGRSKLVGFSEIDPLCLEIYKQANKKFALAPAGDVHDLVGGGASEWGMPQFELCLAGFPCQPFSNVGKRHGFEDDRSNVFFDLHRVIRYYRPRYFVLENVEKIRTLRGGMVLAEIVNRLERLYYKVDVQVLSAENYGLPQQRKRIFFCGRRRQSGMTHHSLPSPAPAELSGSRYPTVWHLLNRAMPARHIVPAGSRRTIFTRNEKWMGDLEIDRLIARPICASMGKWHRANQDNYYTEHFVMSDGGVKPKAFDFRRDVVRRLTPDEALRLQGFPDLYREVYERLNVAPTPAYRTIGNAVPVDLAASVISNLLENG